MPLGTPHPHPAMPPRSPLRDTPLPRPQLPKSESPGCPQGLILCLIRQRSPVGQEVSDKWSKVKES